MQFDRLKRREFITLLGGGSLAWPLAARAQRPAMPVIGFLNGQSPDRWAPYVAAFRQGLNETGYIESQNVTIEYRWAEGRSDRLPALAADLVGRQVNVITSTGGFPQAAKDATTTIPIVALSGGDPVRAGLVASLNRPSGNITGVALFAFSLGPKRLEMLRELLPNVKTVAILANPSYPDPESKLDIQSTSMAAQAIGQKIDILNASNEREIDTAFATLAKRGDDALLVMADPFFNGRREQLVALAAYNKIPAIFEWREFAVAGGLMSYGASITDAYRQVGIYTGKILAGAKPADLPVMQAVKVELVINLETAKALGLTFPITLLGRADEVIE
jgi:putative tryptophan/tyrosine transport system substrate-binding protein